MSELIDSVPESSWDHYETAYWQWVQISAPAEKLSHILPRIDNIVEFAIWQSRIQYHLNQAIDFKTNSITRPANQLTIINDGLRKRYPGYYEAYREVREQAEPSQSVLDFYFDHCRAFWQAYHTPQDDKEYQTRQDYLAELQAGHEHEYSVLEAAGKSLTKQLASIAIDHNVVRSV